MLCFSFSDSLALGHLKVYLVHTRSRTRCRFLQCTAGATVVSGALTRVSPRLSFSQMPDLEDDDDIVKKISFEDDDDDDDTIKFEDDDDDTRVVDNDEVVSAKGKKGRKAAAPAKRGRKPKVGTKASARATPELQMLLPLVLD